MEYTPDVIRQYVHWGRQHIGAALIFVLLSILTSAGYAFISGYASKFGETFASEYPQFRKSVETYTVIDNVLSHIMVQDKASRVSVSRFHDSVRDLASNSIFFVTTDSMVVAPGIAAALDEIKDLPASLFSDIIPELLDHRPVFRKVGDLRAAGLRELALKRGVRALLFMPIFDLNDRLIGFIALSWMNESDIPISPNLLDIEKHLEPQADKIGAYLSARG